jgi:hypothetical protein
MKIPPGYGHKPKLTPHLTQELDEATFSIEDVSQRTGVGRETVRRHALRLGVGRRTLGNRWAFTVDEVEQLRSAMPGTLGRPRTRNE